MQFVYLVEGKDKKALDAALAADPYQKDSFAMTGYTLKESSAVGLKAGDYVLYFKTDLPEVEARLQERLKAVASAKELSGAEKQKIIQQLEEEEANAGAGFGAIFG
ncbi:MAG: hypothetical protein ACP5O3_03665 [Candidatus Micrarchaeia archaeon]|jgi:cell division protein YceG involved in septum cleavage